MELKEPVQVDVIKKGNNYKAYTKDGSEIKLK